MSEFEDGSGRRHTRAVLQCEGVTKSFGRPPAQRMVLRGVSFALQRHEFVALMGRSGSGKSTLVHVVSGLERPDGGRIWFDGRNLAAGDRRTLERIRQESFGFVLQRNNLIAQFTAIENVALPLRIRGVPGRLARERAAEALDSLGLVEVASSWPGELSGGEAARVAIARALVACPAIVFADEPTGALDRANEGIVLDQLRHAVTSTDSACLLVTHDPEVADRADRIICLDDGRIGT